MWRGRRAVFTLVLLSGAVAPAGQVGAAGPGEATVRPATVEAISGSPLKKITLTQKAAQRLDIQTALVSQDAAGKKIVPYSAVVYDTSGTTWVYTNPQPLTFIRHSIAVELIKGAEAVLKDGPAVGTVVVTVGVPELYGAEKGVGH